MQIVSVCLQPHAKLVRTPHGVGLLATLNVYAAVPLAEQGQFHTVRLWGPEAWLPV